MGNTRYMSADDLLKQQEKRPFKRQKTHHSRHGFLRPDSEDDNSSNEVEGSQQLSDTGSVHEDESEHEQDSGLTSSSESTRGLSKYGVQARVAQEEGDKDDDSTDDDISKNLVSNELISAVPSRLRNAPAVKPDRREKATTNPQNNRPSASSFQAMKISTTLVSALTAMAIHTPTDVQAACIPPLLAGRDCVGNAKTGSGKTIAFALPILQKLSVDPYGLFALVLTPTRELAFQISEQFSVLGAPLSIQTAVIVGGMDMVAQAIELDTRPHVVIATPGRLVDHMRSSTGGWNLSRVKFLVLDEADRLLTDSFAPELAYLFKAMPRDRQTCLFTATMTPSIESLIEAPPRPGKQKPFVHRMTDTVETVATLRQFYVLVPSHVREVYLYHLLCNPPESILHLRRTPPEPTKSYKKGPTSKKLSSKKVSGKADEDELQQPPPTIIFCARAKTAAYLTHLLRTLTIRSTALHSHLTQRERLNSLNLFRASVVPVLISTDVGARGLDIEEVAMVINWDMPQEPEEYTHRVGRTARKGKGGVAVSFVTERDEERVLKIEGRINTKLVEMTMPEAKVLENLNKVSTAKRLANMELHDSNFGRREEIHKIKKAKRARDIAREN